MTTKPISAEPLEKVRVHAAIPGHSRVYRQETIRGLLAMIDAQVAELTEAKDRITHLECMATMRTPAEHTLELTRMNLSLAEQQIKALKAERAWRPIETAPKDGQHILCGRFDRTIGYGYFEGKAAPFQAVAHWFVDGFYASSYGCDQEHPYAFTHWAPLRSPDEV